MAKISGKDGKLYYGSSVNISDANHVTGTVTVDCASAHGFATGDLVSITGVVGMTDINDTFEITVTDADTFTISKTTAQSYTSGGAAIREVYLTDFSVEVSGEVADVTDSGNTTWKEYLESGFKAFTGTFEAFMYAGVNKPAEGTELVFLLEMDSSNYFSGSGVITSEGTSLNVPGTDAVKVSYNFQGTGTLTETVG